MRVASNGIVYKRKKGGQDLWYIRLYMVDMEAKERKQKYQDKYISTGLEATRKNLPKANAMLNDELEKHSKLGASTRLVDYCKYWLNLKKEQRETTTYEGYVYKVQHIIDYFTDHPVTLGELKAADVTAFYLSLLKVKKVCPSQRSEKGLSNRTIKDIAVLFRSILDDAVRNEFIVRNPAFKIAPPTHTENHVDKQREHISEKEVAIFLEAIKGHRLEKMFIMCLMLGLRREEAVGLRWSAIREGKIHIEHVVTRMKTTIAKNRTKTNSTKKDASRRCYAISDELQTMLDQIREEQDKNHVLFGTEYHKSDYIFTWEDGRPYSPDYVTKAFKKVVRRDERLSSDLHLHDLRASCVSILGHMGMSFKEIASYVGHADVQTTMNLYARTNEDQMKEVVDTMTDIVYGK